MRQRLAGVEYPLLARYTLHPEPSSDHAAAWKERGTAGVHSIIELARAQGPFDSSTERRAVARSAAGIQLSGVSLPPQGRGRRSALSFTAAERPASLRLAEAWTLTCALKFPLAKPLHRLGRVRTLACALPPGDGLPSEAHAELVMCERHVHGPDGSVWGSEEQLHFAVLARDVDGDLRRWMLCGSNLSQLGHGWHSLAVVGSAGTTTFYVDSRRVGTVPAQVTADVLWVGNHPAYHLRECGAVGVLCDVRIYGSALSAEAIREMEATGHLAEWGGLPRELGGVWGEAGAPPEPYLTDAYETVPVGSSSPRGSGSEPVEVFEVAAATGLVKMAPPNVPVRAPKRPRSSSERDRPAAGGAAADVEVEVDIRFVEVLQYASDQEMATDEECWLVAEPLSDEESSSDEARVTMYKLRQPELENSEHAHVDMARELMSNLGWERRPQPKLSAKIPSSLWPAETWARPRVNKPNAKLTDSFYLCRLCAQSAILTDPQHALPFYSVGRGPAGFNSLPTLESHIIRQHCLPPNEPQAAPEPEPEPEPSDSAATQNAGVEEEQPSPKATRPCTRCTFLNDVTAPCCAMCFAAITGGSLRQRAMLDGCSTALIETKEPEKVGIGDGLLKLTVNRVEPFGSRYLVYWNETDRTNVLTQRQFQCLQRFETHPIPGTEAALGAPREVPLLTNLIPSDSHVSGTGLNEEQRGDTSSKSDGEPGTAGGADEMNHMPTIATPHHADTSAAASNSAQPAYSHGAVQPQQSNNVGAGEHGEIVLE
ncbi:hypothetical protein AB1Y20_016928 [Prymnesium parvum]|uniref:Uncharacterized protein n=1 Tax=Prymnesium parvum TaxID=97485 RepID=A0AB34I9N0_PRYPA